MEKIIKSISEILESEAGLSQTNLDEKERTDNIIDNRYDLLCKEIELYEDKTNDFYTKLIDILAEYINKIYDRKIEYDDNRDVLDEDGNAIEQNYEEYNFNVNFEIEHCNKELCSKLFNHICDILHNNVDVKLDIDTLEQLLNRNPKLFDLSVDTEYLYRMLDYEKLCNILRENNTLEKSNISLDNVYKMLIKTCQINNYEVFGTLIKPEDFKQNHNVIDAFLTICNPRYFAEISQIIVHKLDSDYDRFSILKKRKDEKHFCENVIKTLLKMPSSDSKYQLIHQLLTDNSINIDYNCSACDYYGYADLKDIIAHSGNRLIISDLLNKEENIENAYWHGESCMRLYTLYAIIGKYDEALKNFNSTYDHSYDYYEDYDDDFARRGYTYAEITYKDSLTTFINSLCKSFKKDQANYDYHHIFYNYADQKNMLFSVLNNDRVKYINLSEVVLLVQSILHKEDLNILLDNLYQKYENNNLGFINYKENLDGGIFDYYVIELESDEKVKEIINSVKEEKDSKALVLKKEKNKKSRKY